MRPINKKMSFCRDVPRWIKKVPKHLKAQEMCNEVVCIEPSSLTYVPDHFKTEKMCNDAEKDPYRLGDLPDSYKMARVCEKIIEREPRILKHVPDRLKTARMCERAVETEPWQLYYAPDRFKTQKMCDDVVGKNPYSLLGVRDCSVTSQQIKIWRNSDYSDDEDVIRWYNGYQKRGPQKSH